MRIPWRTLLIWLVPLAAFAWLAVASRAGTDGSAMPLANSLLGGGAVGAQNAYQLHFTTVSVRGNANVAGFYGDWNGHCDGWNGAVTASFYQRVEIKSDGTFKGKGPLESTSAEGTFLFTGRFSGAGSAQGVGRVLFTFVNGNSRYKCDTGDVSWQVRTSLNRFGRSRPAAGRSYFGNTGQRLPMSCASDKAGKRADSCDSGPVRWGVRL